MITWHAAATRWASKDRLLGPFPHHPTHPRQRRLAHRGDRQDALRRAPPGAAPPPEPGRVRAPRRRRRLPVEPAARRRPYPLPARHPRPAGVSAADLRHRRRARAASVDRAPGVPLHGGAAAAPGAAVLSVVLVDPAAPAVRAAGTVGRAAFPGAPEPAAGRRPRARHAALRLLAAARSHAGRTPRRAAHQADQGAVRRPGVAGGRRRRTGPGVSGAARPGGNDGSDLHRRPRRDARRPRPVAQGLPVRGRRAGAAAAALARPHRGRTGVPRPGVADRPAANPAGRVGSALLRHPATGRSEPARHAGRRLGRPPGCRVRGIRPRPAALGQHSHPPLRVRPPRRGHRARSCTTFRPTRPASRTTVPPNRG